MSGPVWPVWDPGLNRLSSGHFVVPGIVLAHKLNEQEFEFLREADTKYSAGVLPEVGEPRGGGLQGQQR